MSSQCLQEAQTFVQQLQKQRLQRFIFFPSLSTDPATVMAWQTQLSYLGSKPVSFPFFQTHTHILTVSFDNREADIISYTVVFPPLFQDHRGTKQTHYENHC